MPRLLVRVTAIFLLLSAELLPFVRWFRPGLITSLAVQFLTVFIASLLAMNLMGSARSWRLRVAELAVLPGRWTMLIWHAGAVVLWVILSWALMQSTQQFFVMGLLIVA